MKKTKVARAFSLMEVSIVIVVIGILVAGVNQGLGLFYKTKIKSAQALTKGSRVNNIKGLIVWYEPTLDESFISSETNNGSTISQWNDVNPQSSDKLHAKAGQKTDATQITYNLAAGGTSGNTSGPTYVERGINNLPTLRFTNSGSSAYRYLTVDKRMSNVPTGSMTLFLVMTYRSGAGHFIDRQYHDANYIPVATASAINGGQPLFQLYSASDGSLSAYIRSNTVDFSSIGTAGWDVGYDLKSGSSYIIAVQRNYGSNFTVYVNGNSTYAGGTPSKTDSGEPITLDPYKIGRHAVSDTQDTDIDVSEFIFYADNVSTKDRKLIEDYLGKKYNIKVTH